MKTKKIIAFMSAVAMIGTYSFTDFLPEYMGSPVSVVSAGTYENFEYSVNEEDEITITGYYGSETEVVVPSEIEGKKVTTIGRRVFRYRSMTRVVLPDTINSIGEDAFADCEQLESIVMPEHMEYIGKWAFSSCKSLKSIVIPDGIKEMDWRFSGCDSLTEISIPASVKYIGKDFENLKTVKGQKYTPAYEFAKRYSYEFEEIYFADMSVPVYNVDLERSYDEVNYDYDYTHTSEDERFKYKDFVYKVERNGEITIIGANIYAQTITVPEEIDGHKVTAIGNGAFDECNYIEKIEFTDSITRIGKNNFTSESLEVEKVNGLWYYNNWLVGSDGYWIDNYSNNEQTELGKQKKVEVREGTVGISDYAFETLYELEELIIPESVLYIGQYALGMLGTEDGSIRGYDALKKVEIKGNNLKSIGDGAFCGQYSLEEINIPDSVEYLGINAFSWTRLQKLKSSKSDKFPEKIKDASYYPFWYTNSNVVEIPESLENLYADYLYAVPEGNLNRFIPMNASRDMDYNLGKTECVIIHPGTMVDKKLLYYTSEEEKENQYKEIFFLGDESELKIIDIPKTEDEYWFAFSTEVPEDAEKIKINYNCKIINEGSAEYVICNNEAYLFKCDEDVTEFTISSSAGGFPVTRILPGAFADCSEIRELIIPENITLIGNNAFDNCSSLEKITFSKNNILPSDTEYIIHSDRYNGLMFREINGVENLFDGCTSLKEIIIDEENSDYFTFENCIYSKEPQRLLFCPETCEKLNILPNTTEIAMYACEECSINEISGIPATVTKIGEYAFYGCDFKEIIIPDSVKEIGQFAFALNPELETVKLSGGMKTISNNLFGGCTGIEYIEIPDSVESIEYEAFYNTSLKEIIIPASVSSISQGVFDCPGEPYGNMPLRGSTSRTVKIYGEKGSAAEKYAERGGSGIIYSGMYRIPFMDISQAGPVRAKYKIKNNDEYEYFVKEDGTLEICGCLNNLEKIEIPSVIDGMPVTSVSAYAFTSCSDAVTVSIPESIKKTGENAFNISKLESVVYSGKKDQWMKTDFGRDSFSSKFKLICSDFEIGTGEDIIHDDWTYCVDYTLNASVKYNNKEAETVKVPSEIEGYSVTGLSNAAFYNFSDLKKVEIPDGITAIGVNAFYKCESLTDIVLPDGITSIGKSTFEGCSKLEKTDLPDNIQNIGERAFAGCSALKSIKIPDKITMIEDSTFEECASLSDVIIPDSVLRIGKGTYSNSGRVFKNCTSLNKIKLPNKLEVLQYETFSGCVSLREITIPDSVTLVSDEVFSDCTSLETVKFSKNMEILSRKMFSGCTGLKKISIPENISLIGNYAFEDCTGLVNVELPDNDELRISSGAFSGCTGIGNIEIPESVIFENEEEYFKSEYAFGYYYDKETREYIKYSPFSISGYTGSQAEKYALDNEIEFISIGAAPIVTEPVVTTTEPVTTTEKTTTPVVTTTEKITTPVVTTTEKTTTPVVTTTEKTTTPVVTTTEEVMTTTPVVTTTEKTTTPVVTTTEKTTTPVVTTTPEVITTTPEVTVTNETTIVSVTEPLPVTTPGSDENKAPSDIVKNAEKLESEVFDEETIRISEDAKIDVSVPDLMGYQSTGAGKIKYTFSLSEFNAEETEFNYAAFGLDLPEGFTFDDVSLVSDNKSETGTSLDRFTRYISYMAESDSQSIISGKIRYAEPGSAEAEELDKQSGKKASGGYIILNSAEVKNASDITEMFEVTLNIPEKTESNVNIITVSSMFGRYTENTSVAEDGTVTPHVAFIANSEGEKLYSEKTVKYLTGLRGDVNLDGVVNQLDATVILKEILSVAVSGKSILPEAINTESAGEDSEKLSHFLGDVDLSSEGRNFEQIDATSILKVVLAADMAGQRTVSDELWDKVIG